MKKKKVVLHQDSAPCHRPINMTARIHKFHFELLPQPPYSPDLASSDFYLFADLQRMLAGKEFGTNGEMILETDAYFVIKEQSFYK